MVVGLGRRCGGGWVESLSVGVWLEGGGWRETKKKEVMQIKTLCFVRPECCMSKPHGSTIIHPHTRKQGKKVGVLTQPQENVLPLNGLAVVSFSFSRLPAHSLRYLVSNEKEKEKANARSRPLVQSLLVGLSPCCLVLSCLPVPSSRRRSKIKTRLPRRTRGGGG
jgi:hypothetical protein